MGWEDRQYGSENRASGSNILWSIFFGSFPIGTVAGIRIRVHASLPFLIATTILFEWSKGWPIQARIISMAMLFGIVLLHEFGHCFAARAVGGSADQILLWPLGGLASADPPNRPLPTFITIAAGPAVNLALCIISGACIWLLGAGMVPLFPFFARGTIDYRFLATHTFAYYAFCFYIINYILLLFNLLPIYPLDGGQMFQSILWPHIGYRRSMTIACRVGMVGAGVLALLGLLTFNLMLLMVAIFGFMTCYQRLMIIREMGIEDWSSEYEGVDYAASLKLPQHFDTPKRKRRISKWKLRRLRRRAMEEAAEQERLDAILAKVSARGIASLTWGERRVLRRATERKRQQDEMEITR